MDGLVKIFTSIQCVLYRYSLYFIQRYHIFILMKSLNIISSSFFGYFLSSAEQMANDFQN